MLYVDPTTVIGPQDLIDDVDVLYDGGEDGVSIARLTWNGTPVIAMRWNVAQREWDNPDKANEAQTCMGMPVSNAHPVWFILPHEMFDPSTEVYRVMEKLKKR